MKPLRLESKIVSLANSLRLSWTDPVTAIVEYCRARIAGFCRNAEITSIADLEAAVCRGLNLVIHEVWSDEEVTALSQRYVFDEGQLVFAYLAEDLDETTFGLLIERRNCSGGNSPRYIAVVDCRGAKAYRAFFTKWHEIAHALTAVEQFELPFKRTSIPMEPKDPIERLMDQIAGEIGFSKELFDPLLDAELRTNGVLGFAAVERVRTKFSPKASFQATLNACIKRNKSPLVLVTAGLGLRAAEARALLDPQIPLIAPPTPRRQLRVLTAIQNDAARGSALFIRPNMRVPPDSLITAVFRDESISSARSGGENLGIWMFSDGKSLPSVRVRIEAKRIEERVLAIVAPEE